MSPFELKQQKKKDKHCQYFISICWSLFALLLVGYLTFLTGQREADNEGKKLFIVQQIIFVMIQVFQHLLRKFGVPLSLKEHHQGTSLGSRAFIHVGMTAR